MTRSASMIRCPNPEHTDNNPSCALYENGPYCFSRCGKISIQQIEEWTGQKYETTLKTTEQSRIPSNNGRPLLSVSPKSLVDFYFRTLTDGPRRSRMAWFHRRGFTNRSITRFRFGHTGTHFVIPLWQNELIVGCKLRRDEEYIDGPKYINTRGQPVVVVRPLETGTPTVIVEGELDAYLLAQFGIDAITVSTGAGSLRLLQHLELDTAYIIPDMDKVGIEAAKEMEELQEATTIHLPMGKDITEYLVHIEADERARSLRSLFREADKRKRGTNGRNT